MTRRSAGQHHGQSTAGNPLRGFVLHVMEGPTRGDEVAFSQAATIGRGDDNDISIRDSGFSRHHARIFESHGAYLLEDRSSANGTRLNNERIEAVEVLQDGDLITISTTTFIFSILNPVRGDATKQSDIAPDATRETPLHPAESARQKARRTTLHRIIALLGVCCLAVVAVSLLRYFTGDDPLGGSDRSDIALTYSESAFNGAVLGFGNYDRRHRDRVMVDFDHLGGRVTIQYGARAINHVGEGIISLNGKKVATIPLTMSHWKYGLRLELPKAYVKREGRNRLVFKNTKNPRAREEWEIYDLKIFQESMPRADLAQAQAHFSSGLKAWADRNIAPGNLALALDELRTAETFLYEMNVKPDLYRDIRARIEIVDRELTKIFNEVLFTARRFDEVDHNIEAAQHVLSMNLRRFSKEDFRRREIEKELAALSDNGN